MTTKTEFADGEQVMAVAPAAGRWALVRRRFFARRTGPIGLVLLLLLAIAAFFGGHLVEWTYESKDFMAFMSPPSPRHWFGTTGTGGDMYVQTLRGAQKSLMIGLLVAVVATATAAFVGSFAAYFGKWVDSALMWVVDLLLVLPGFLIVALLSPLFTDGNWILFVVLLAAFSWMVTSRVVRSMTMSLREREFVLAARFLGVATPKIIFRHILPNMSSILIVDVTVGVSLAIVAETNLSYFGFGVQPPDVSLGTLIAGGSTSVTTFWWLFAFPAGFLFLILLAVNLAGDGLRDALDPSSGGGR